MSDPTEHHPGSLGAATVLQLIGELRQIIQATCQEQKRLEDDRRIATASIDRKLRDALSQGEAATEAETEAIEESIPREDARLRARFEARKEKITRAYSSAKASSLGQVDQSRGEKLAQIQAKQMQVRKELEAELAVLDSQFNELRAELPPARKRFHALEKSATRVAQGTLSRLTTSGESKHESANPLLVLLGDLLPALDDAEKNQAELMRDSSVKMAALLPPVIVMPTLILAGMGIGAALGISTLAGIGAAVFGLLLALAHFAFAKSTGAKHAAAIAGFHLAVGKAKSAMERIKAGASFFSDKKSELENAFGLQEAEIRAKFAGTSDSAESQRQESLAGLNRRRQAANLRNETQLEARLARVTDLPMRRIAEVKQSWQKECERLQEEATHRRQVVEENYRTGWETLISDWEVHTKRIERHRLAVAARGAALFPDWSPELCEKWEPPTEFSRLAKFGSVEVNVPELAGEMPDAERLPYGGELSWTVPLLLSIPTQANLLFETKRTARDALMSTINQVILRLLAQTPPGRIEFCLFDPVGLGQSFSSLAHLADFEDSVIQQRIWTQSQQLEQRLHDLSEHIEKVIQIYLRNEYSTITEYNEAAGNIAEKYRFLVLADFPHGVSDVAAKRLMSIAESGARCGVFVIMHWDSRSSLPEAIDAESLRDNCITFHCEGDDLQKPQSIGRGASLRFDSMASGEWLTSWLQRLGASSEHAGHVQVPFSYIAPKSQDEWWTASTEEELTVAIGRKGATKMQELEIGRATKQHALIAGKTGAGKSNLFHVMIMNLALHHSPDEVEFYLIDFKKGVEFKVYATHRMPHARVIAIESDREFGLSVLQRVDEELRHRGEQFRDAGVQDLPNFRRSAQGRERPMPRQLLVIDEFQEFFTEDDRVAQEASVLLDRIVRQGRAFGIHVLLGSQTLGGSYTLPRTTMGQMAIRIALQCNEADAAIIMDDDNPAPRSLTRPGEGIYNDTAGSVEGNSPFQAVLLPESERHLILQHLADFAQEKNLPSRGLIIFEGNAPADPLENSALVEALARMPAPAKPRVATAWLGAPNAIKSPTAALFRRQSGAHLLIVGQREEANATMVMLCLLSLAAQFPPDEAEFYLIDGSPLESREQEIVDAMVALVPGRVMVHRGSHAPDQVIPRWAEEMEVRSDSGDATTGQKPAFLFVLGLHRFKALRNEDEFAISFDSDAGANVASQFTKLLEDGSAHGIHLVVTVDSYGNLKRWLSRKSIGEFDLKVAFQMSANDSASLLDTTDAANLGMHRALFQNEGESRLETFRPYALPDIEAVKNLQNR